MTAIRSLRVKLSSLKIGVFFFLAVGSSPAFGWIEPVQKTDLNTQQLSCSSRYERQECQEHLTRLKTVLSKYPIQKLGNWTWVLVSSEEWNPLIRRLHLDARSIAFSTLKQRTIVLEQTLFLLHGPRAKALADNLEVPVDQLVSMAVSHELGHILCRNSSEAVAEQAAEQLRQGKRIDCWTGGKSLSRMEEQMYEHSRTFGLMGRR
jgi:hypothetical protein